MRFESKNCVAAHSAQDPALSPNALHGFEKSGKKKREEKREKTSKVPFKNKYLATPTCQTVIEQISMSSIS